MKLSEIDPSKPLLPLKTWKEYPVPATYSGYWTEEDWEKTAVVRGEQMEMTFFDDEVWVAVGRNCQGTILYQRKKEISEAIA